MIVGNQKKQLKKDIQNLNKKLKKTIKLENQ